jgi:hypothetical protein
MVLLVVMLERRKQVSACRNHITGSEVQNFGSFTATAETGAGCCRCGSSVLAAMAAATAALMRALIAASNCASCSAFIVAWEGSGNNNNNGGEQTDAPFTYNQQRIYVCRRHGCNGCEKKIFAEEMKKTTQRCETTRKKMN